MAKSGTKSGTKNLWLLLNRLKVLGKYKRNGGEGGIRTHDGLAPMPVFKTGAFNRSATSPFGCDYGKPPRLSICLNHAFRVFSIFMISTIQFVVEGA